MPNQGDPDSRTLIDRGNCPEDQLEDLQVQSGGDQTSIVFNAKFSLSGRKFIHVPHLLLPSVITEVDHASRLLVISKRQTLDSGEAWLKELCRTALSPIHQDVVVSPFDGDIIYINQFADRAPIPIRMTPLGMVNCHRKTVQAMKWAAN